MSAKPNYWWAAFNLRPFGMPVPPNWFGLATFGLLGVFLNPGFLLLGAGLEIAYLATLGGSPRFRKAIDAASGVEDPVDQRYLALLGSLDPSQRKRQEQVEGRAREILSRLAGSSLLGAHADSLQQLVWLHLRLLAAREAVAEVVATSRREHGALEAQEKQLAERLAQADLDPGLRRSLEQQQVVIDQRQAAHADASRRYEQVESELQRIDQQIALIREQTLLAADQQNLGDALDSLAASYNEASRWLDGQRDLLGSLDAPLEQRLPQRVLQGASPPLAREGEKP
jgi:DNA repair exonuclease SbcCD ATPase subunit